MPEALYQPFPMAGDARAQIWRYCPQFRRPRHVHAEPELNIVARGTAAFGAGKSVVPVSAGDLVWWLPGQDHELLVASDDLDLFVVGLTPELSARVLGGALASAYAGPTVVRLPSDALARLCATGAAPQEPRDVPAVERLVGDLWAKAHALRTTLPGKHALTRRVLHSFADRKDLDRTEIARLARTDPSEVSRHFRRNIGLTLTTYRTRLRLLRFIDTAQDGTRSLLSAALDAEFGSYSQCHRAFRRTFGCSPRRFFQGGMKDRMRGEFSPLR